MDMGPLLYVFIGIGVLFLLIIGSGLWRIVTFRSPLLHNSPAAYARLQLQPLSEVPERLRTREVEAKVQDLERNGFKDLGSYAEVLGGEVPTRQFYSAEHSTYATIFTTDEGEPFVSYTTTLDDGMISFTCTSGALAGIFGKLINQAEPNYGDRLTVHLEELARMQDDGGKPQADGTLEDRMRLCKEWYRYHTGAYATEEAEIDA